MRHAASCKTQLLYSPSMAAGRKVASIVLAELLYISVHSLQM